MDKKFSVSKRLALLTAATVFCLISSQAFAELWTGGGGSPPPPPAPPVNNSPVINVQSSTSVLAGENLTFSVTTSDPDGDTVTLGATNFPPGAAFDGQTVTWTPYCNQAGAYNINFTADDGRGGTASASVAITVDSGSTVCSTAGEDVAQFWTLPPTPPTGATSAFQPPVLTAPSSLTIPDGKLSTIAISVSDPNGYAITLSAANLPDGMTFDLATLTFSWTPDCSQLGDHTLVVTASNGNGGVASATINITVVAASMSDYYATEIPIVIQMLSSLNLPRRTQNNWVGELNEAKRYFARGRDRHGVREIAEFCERIEDLVERWNREDRHHGCRHEGNEHHGHERHQILNADAAKELNEKLCCDVRDDDDRRFDWDHDGNHDRR